MLNSRLFAVFVFGFLLQLCVLTRPSVAQDTPFIIVHNDGQSRIERLPNDQTSPKQVLTLTQFMQNPARVGKGIFKVMFLKVYTAELIAANGLYDPNKAAALRLTYKMDISGKSIADESVRQIRDLGYKNEVRIAGWNSAMKNIFPDVIEGDTLTGVRTHLGESHFYHNDQFIGSMRDPEFTQLFFDIWLSEDTQAPQLRRKLIANNHSTNK
jgi:hypothetical protein